MAFSLGMHSLLAIILIGGAAFESTPRTVNVATLTMLPANILDTPGVGGGSPNAVPPPPQPAPAAPPEVQPIAPPRPLPQTPPPQPAISKPAPPKPVKLPEPKPIEREIPEPAPHALLPAPKPARKTHEVQVDYTPYNASANKVKKPKTDENDEAAANAAAAASAARAEARRQKAFRQALASLDSGLTSKASSRSAPEDNPGEGGPSFADYGSVVRSIYDGKWMRPDNVANKFAITRVKIVVAHDGAIMSAEIVGPSGESVVDKSVERALRAVSSLPEFPHGATDSQRTFYINFNLHADE
ncbi:MAG TPA: energy transducer TonB [Verrucomicrobiae bacterium]|nr:energy transducer TonB [Verrucomicrobiae bacterium]